MTFTMNDATWFDPELSNRQVRVCTAGQRIIEREAVNTLLTCMTADWKDRSPDYLQTPTRAVFNGPATILFWPDGTKTVVKCQEGDEYDREKGVAMAMLKKYFGGKGRYNDVLRNLIETGENG